MLKLKQACPKIFLSMLLLASILLLPIINNTSVFASKNLHVTHYTHQQITTIKQNAVKHLHGIPILNQNKKGVIISSGGGDGTPPLTYVGESTGKMMHSSKVYLIFWKPSGYSFDTNYESNIIQYYDDIAASSTSLYNIATQYYDNTNGHFTNGITLGGSTEDTTSFPTSGQCTDYATPAGCLTESQIQNEIKSVSTANSWDTGYNVNYMLYTPLGIGSDFTDSSGTHFAYESQAGVSAFCGFHNSNTIGTTNAYIYGVIAEPNLNTAAYPAHFYPCEPITSPPTDINSDNAISYSSHEHFEMITNPDPLDNLGTGPVWVTNDGAEIGDLCDRSYGSGLSYPHSNADIEINSHYYEIQEEYSNFTNSSGVATGCTLSPGSGQMMTGSTYTISGNNLNTYNTSDGSFRSIYAPSGSSPINDPVASSGKVFYVDGSNSQLKSLNATTGASTGITYNLNGSTHAGIANFSPYLSSNTLYVGMNDDSGAYVEAFDPTCTTCNDLWKLSLDYGMSQQVTVANNVLYVPVNHNRIEAFDLTTNPPTPIWDLHTLSTGMNTSITVDSSGNIYYGYHGIIYAISATESGSTWSFNLLWTSSSYGTTSSTSPLTLNGSVLYYDYTPYGGGTNIDAINTSDGSNVWSEVTLSDTYTASPIVIAGTSMYLGTANGAYSYNKSTGAQNWHEFSGTSFNELFNTNGSTFFLGDGGFYEFLDSNGDVRNSIDGSSSTGLGYSLNAY